MGLRQPAREVNASSLAMRLIWAVAVLSLREAGSQSAVHDEIRTVRRSLSGMTSSDDMIEGNASTCDSPTCKKCIFLYISGLVLLTSLVLTCGLFARAVI